MVQLQRRVERLELTLASKPPDHIVLIWSFGPDEEPHGKYGYRKRHLLTGEAEPVTEQDEVDMLRDYYEMRVPDLCKKSDGIYPTFEVFLRGQECKCGRKHPYADPEYRFRNTWRP